MTIIPYFDPILGKLRNSDVALISIASLIVTDPLIVNNLIVNSNATINTLRANSLIASTATLGLTHISTIDWNLTSGATVTQEGQMNWDANQQTAVIGMAGGNVDLALGMEQLFPRRVRNSTGSTMAKGTVVYINGVSGNTPTVERAIATSDMSSAFTLGMTAEDIANTATGWVTTFGELTGLDLSAYTGGDTLYLSGATAGAFTNVPQSAPIHYVRVGTVVKATTDGALVVNVLNGYELNELHNVVISSLASGQILQSGASSYWYNRSLASAVNELNLLASLGSLAVMNQLSFTSLTNQPSLGSIAFQNTVDYSQLTNTPSLGSLAVMNQLSFTSLTNQPSLSSLAFQSTIDYNSAQLLNKPSLGSLAPLNAITQEYLPSTASFTYLFVDDIRTGGLAVTSTASIRNIRTTGLVASNATISGALDVPNIFGLNFLGVASTLIAETGIITNVLSTDISNNSNISTNTLYANIISGGTYLNLPSLGSLAIMNQLSFTSLLNQPSLSSLAFQSTVDYSQITGTPSLGSLAVMNQLSFTSLTNQPSLASLAFQNGPLPANSPASTNRFITAYNSSTGAFTIARPTWANIDKTTSPINDLSDVTISSPQNNEVLTYEASTNSWKNKSNPVQENILENANHINNSTNGYGGISNGWTDASANPIQGGFPYLEWDAVYDPGATTAFWYLNEASGNAIDGKTGTYPLTDTNTVGASATLGLMDYARSFNGTNQRFSGTVALGNVAGSQTFVAFVRPNVVNVAQHICGYNDGTRNAYLGISATGKAFFNFTGTTPTIVTSDVTLEANKWYLIIGSYDSGGELRIFVNGVYKAVSCTGTHVVTTNNIFQIGATNSANHFNGYMNAVAHYYQIGWDEEKMLSLFAVSIYKNTKIYRSDTVSEISLYQLLGREQMHRFNSQTVTFSAEVYQTNSSNAKVTIYNGLTNYDSNIVSSTGSWETVSVTFTFGAANAEVYFNLRTSSGAVGPIWYRNIKLNYGNTAIGNNIHNVLDWQKFPRLLMLDIPKMFDGKPYQYEENKWYTWTPTTNPTGATGGNTEWKFQGNKCFIKGQLTQTHASATWTHTLPIYTGSGEVIRGRWGKVQNNTGAVGLGNWFQTTVNSSSVNMYSSIANAAWSTTSGAKVFIFDMTEWEID